MSAPGARITVHVGGVPVVAELPPETVDALRRLLRDGGPAPAAPGPYMTTAEAAEYLRCAPQRIHELVGRGCLTRHKEGGRLLLARAEVAALVRAEPGADVRHFVRHPPESVSAGPPPIRRKPRLRRDFVR